MSAKKRPRGGASKQSMAARQAQIAAEQRAQAEAALRKRRRLIAVVAVAALAIITLIIVVTVQFAGARSAPKAGAQGAPRFGPVPVDRGKPLRFGAAKVKHTVRIYFDAHCSHCAEAEEKLGPALAKHVEDGTAAVELYPLGWIDEGSRGAARGLGCAAQAGFGWEFYQRLWGGNAKLSWSDEQVVSLGKQVAGGTSTDEFERCVTRKKLQDWSKSIDEAAASSGVDASPRYFLDGEKLDYGTITPAEFEKKLA